MVEQGTPAPKRACVQGELVAFDAHGPFGAQGDHVLFDVGSEDPSRGLALAPGGGPGSAQWKGRKHPRA